MQTLAKQHLLRHLNKLEGVTSWLDMCVWDDIPKNIKITKDLSVEYEVEDDMLGTCTASIDARLLVTWKVLMNGKRKLLSFTIYNDEYNDQILILMRRKGKLSLHVIADENDKEKFRGAWKFTMHHMRRSQDILDGQLYFLY